MNEHVLRTAKMYAALVGAIVTALLAQFGPDGVVGGVLTALGIIASVVAVYRVPNRDPQARHQDESVQPPNAG